MFDVKEPDIAFEHLADIYSQLDKRLQEYLLAQAELLLELHTEMKK